jgi:hypothetical protein
MKKKKKNAERYSASKRERRNNELNLSRSARTSGHVPGRLAKSIASDSLRRRRRTRTSAVANASEGVAGVLDGGMDSALVVSALDDGAAAPVAGGAGSATDDAADSSTGFCGNSCASMFARLAPVGGLAGATSPRPRSGSSEASDELPASCCSVRTLSAKASSGCSAVSN